MEHTRIIYYQGTRKIRCVQYNMLCMYPQSLSQFIYVCIKSRKCSTLERCTLPCKLRTPYTHCQAITTQCKTTYIVVGSRGEHFQYHVVYGTFCILLHPYSIVFIYIYTPFHQKHVCVTLHPKKTNQVVHTFVYYMCDINALLLCTNIY